MARRQRFKGEHTQKVDGKGRVSIPALFRRVIEAGDPDWVEGKPATLTVIEAFKQREFLECYTVEAMDEVYSQIERIPRGHPHRKAMQHLFSAKATEIGVDGTGRLVLPKKVRDTIGLGPDSEAYFKADGDTFQIWNAETFEAAQMAEIDAVFDSLPDGADPLIILDQYSDR